MFIVRLVGSDEKSPFKRFQSQTDATTYAREKAKGDIERVLVYEWSGVWEEGVAAARAGQLKEIGHFPHQETPWVPPPEPPLRLTKEAEKQVQELIKKIPKMARKMF